MMGYSAQASRIDPRDYAEILADLALWDADPEFARSLGITARPRDPTIHPPAAHIGGTGECDPRLPPR